MADTINELYLKYANEISPVLEEDRYFQYLYEAIQSGKNILDQQSVIVHKTVDEEWLSFIESKIDSIFNVVQKPRRFLKSTEEIVPVDLARKVTAESVRHLSQNTQFIANSEDGDVRPTKVLNVTSEETYDIYENRFIYHLIQKLISFVDKRTDAIFWSTGDESYDLLKFTSKFSDENEDVDYELSMRIRSKEDAGSKDSEGMGVYLRIDKLRRLIMQLKRSAFCEIMAGCAKVRSPIQRTNLIMKDHDYKACFALWQFLERYDSIGYSIDEEKKALQFDEEYLIQFYTNFIANYISFKSLLVPDRRDILKSKRKAARKPKFRKTIKELKVDSPSLEDVEIRRVFVEYITKAQLEAEARAAEAEKRRKAAEAEAAAAAERAEEADRQRDMMQLRMDEAVLESERSEEAKRLAETREAEARAAASLAIAESKEAAALKIEAFAVRDSAIKAKTEAEAFAESTVLKARAHIEKTAKEAEAIVSEARRDRDEQIAKAARDRDEQIAQAVREKDAIVEKTVSAAQTKIKETTRRASAIVEETARDAKSKIDREMAEAKRLSAQANSELTQAEKTRAYAQARIEEAEKLSAEAENAKAEAERLMKKVDKLVQQKLSKVRGLSLAEYLALRLNAKQQRRSGK